MENYMTAREVAAKVHLSEQTIRRYTMLKQIPFHKVFRAVRYKPSEIEKWFEERQAKEKAAGNEAGLFANGVTAGQTGAAVEGGCEI